MKTYKANSAEFLVAYAETLKQCDMDVAKANAMWEYNNRGNDSWHTSLNRMLITSQEWHEKTILRLKPKTIKINGTNMKPFDPEKAKCGDTVVIRNGDSRRILCIDAPGSHPVVAMAKSGFITRHTLEGREYFDRPSSHDLFMATIKKEGWVNIYPGGQVGHFIFATKQSAKADRINACIDTVRIEWEE